MKNEIRTNASKIGRKKRFKKIVKISLLIFITVLLLLYVVVGIVYTEGNFSITLDKNLYFERGIIIFDDFEYKVYRSELYAEAIDTFDNIAYKWLPDDLNDSEGGSHNGDNYVAYTFYVENTGEVVADYWSEVIIDDVINGLDEAIRVRIYKNGEYATYAKIGANGKAETETTPFESEEIITSDHVEDFEPGDIDKYTIVLWLEGTDPECTDNILGGEIKIHMAFNSEFVEE